jgi:hypothetical protein
MLKIKHIYLQGRGIYVKNGVLTKFWQDPWLFDEPLAVVVPTLFELSKNKSISVAQAIQGEPICFRRWLHFELRAQWEKVWEAARNFQLDNSQDNIFWNLGKSRKFTVKSVYDGLTKDDSGLYHKKIWKSKIPAKIKIFLWLMTFDVLLTRDNLRKRKWQGDPCCVFCDCEESIPHLFFQCPVARIVWSVCC